MKYLLLAISVLTLLVACQLDGENQEKYEIAADKDISGPYMKLHNPEDQLELTEAYPLEDGQPPRRMLMDSPEERRDQTGNVKNRKDGAITPFPDEEPVIE